MTELTRAEIEEMSRLSATALINGCCNCGSTEGNGTIKMIIPKEKGGRLIESNIYFICNDCNRRVKQAEENKRAEINRAISEGMHRAKLEGSQIGRSRLTKDNLPKAFYEYYTAFLNRNITKTEYCKLINVSRPTLDRYIKVMKGER